jgi:hypothetical protein
MLVVREKKNPLFSQLIMISLAKVLDSERTNKGMDQKIKKTKQKQFFHVSTVIPSKFMSTGNLFG